MRGDGGESPRVLSWLEKRRKVALTMVLGAGCAGGGKEGGIVRAEKAET